jgi:[ribosomal protein S5]-alanine N-acetyltransferase
MISNDEHFQTFMVGERLYLRKLRISDVNGNYYHWMNDPEVTQYLESRFYPNSIDKLIEYVKEKIADKNNIFLAIVLKEKDQHIGNIKLDPINWIHRRGDIGIIIGEKSCWGKGYASEAIGVLVKYSFQKLNLHKLTAGCYALNSGALKAFQKKGFEIEGSLKKHSLCNGRYVDVVQLGLINPSKKESQIFG